MNSSWNSLATRLTIRLTRAIRRWLLLALSVGVTTTLGAVESSPCRVFRDDDGTREAAASIDYRDDRLEKTIHLDVSPSTAAFARLWIYGQPYNFAGFDFVSREDYYVRVNGEPDQELSFDVGAAFSHQTDRFQWVPFEIPGGWLREGPNTFFISESRSVPRGAWNENNLRIGIDTDNDADSSWWRGNGLNCGSSDRCQGELMVYLELCSEDVEVEPRFLRGDANTDGKVDVSDPIAILGVLLLGEGEFRCMDAADANDDGQVDISDAITVLGVLFLGDGEIPAPGMKECGNDPTEDGLGCDAFPHCTDGKTDLTLDSVSARSASGRSCSAFASDEAVEVEAVVTNESRAGVRGATVAVFDGRGEIGSATFDLGPGETTTVTVGVELSGPGFIELAAVVDPEDEVEEADEGNNTGTAGVFVSDETFDSGVSIASATRWHDKVVFAASLTVNSILELVDTDILICGDLEVSGDGSLEAIDSRIYVGGETVVHTGGEIHASVSAAVIDRESGELISRPGRGQWTSVGALRVSDPESVMRVSNLAIRLRGGFEVRDQAAGLFTEATAEVQGSVLVAAEGSLTLSDTRMRPVDPGDRQTSPARYSLRVDDGALRMSEGSLERLQGGVELAGNAEAYLSRATIAGSESVGIDVAGSSRVVLTDCRIAGTADAAVRISDTSDCLVEVHSTSLNPLDPEGDEIQIVDEDESEAHVVVDWLVGGVVRDPHGKSFENACAVFEGSDGSRRRVESGDDGLLEDSRLKEWEFRDGHRTEFNPYEVTVFGPDCLGEPIGSIPFPVDDDRVIPPFFRPPTQTGASCQADITINPDGNSGVGIAINVSQITLPPIQFDPDNHQAQVELTWCYEEGDVQTTLPPSISEGLDVWKFALGEAGQGEPGGADATSCSTSTNMDCISIVDGGVSCAGDSTRNSDSGSLAISLPGPTDANGDPIPGVMTYYVDAHARWELWDCTQTIKAKEASQSAQIVVQVTFANFVDEVEMLNPLSASPDDVDAGSVAGPGAVMDVYAGQEIPIIVDYQWSENGSTDDEQWFFYAYSGGWWLSPSANWTPCDFGSGGDDEVTIEDSWDWGANQNGDGQLEFTITAPGASDSSCIFETNGQQEAEITIYLTASCMTASPAGDYGAVTLYFRVHQP